MRIKIFKLVSIPNAVDQSPSSPAPSPLPQAPLVSTTLAPETLGKATCIDAPVSRPAAAVYCLDSVAEPPWSLQQKVGCRQTAAVLGGELEKRLAAVLRFTPL